MTCFYAMSCPLGIDYNPQNLRVGGVNRHFQAKLVKFQHLHIIETTDSHRFRRNFVHNTVKNTIKYSSWVAQTNPRWQTVAILKISKNRHMSGTVWRIAPIKIVHNDAQWPSKSYRQLKVPVFTARRSYASSVLGFVILSVRQSVRLSVCHTRTLWLMQSTYQRYFYTTQNCNPSSFLPPNSGWWTTSPST